MIYLAKSFATESYVCQIAYKQLFVTRFPLHFIYLKHLQTSHVHFTFLYLIPILKVFYTDSTLDIIKVNEPFYTKRCLCLKLYHWKGKLIVLLTSRSSNFRMNEHNIFTLSLILLSFSRPIVNLAIHEICSSMVQHGQCQGCLNRSKINYYFFFLSSSLFSIKKPLILSGNGFNEIKILVWIMDRESCFKHQLYI